MKRNESDFLEFAKTLARSAGKIIMEGFGKKTKQTKKKDGSFVTETDLKSDKYIKGEITKKYPNHSILAEESGRSGPVTEYTWVIDPIDGTHNFMHGFPFFSVSIALVKNGKQIVGVVYDPLRKEMFHATANGGAYLNGREIKVADTSELKNSLLITGFYTLREDLAARTLKAVGDFIHQGLQGVRRSGSAALDICYVACGRSDGFWEYLLHPWDFAAASLIAREAGAKVTNTQGGEIEIGSGGIVAANPQIHEKMLKIVNV